MTRASIQPPVRAPRALRLAAVATAIWVLGCGQSEDQGGAADAGPKALDGVGVDGLTSDGHPIDSLQAPDGAGPGGADAAPDVTDGAGGCPGRAGCPCEADQDCDDGDACTWGEICMFGKCAQSQVALCDDGNACTDDHCEPATGCTQTANEALCSDLDNCTYGDRCQGGLCLANIPKTCDDGNKCTDDACDPSQGCVFQHNAIECSPGNACVEKSFCAWGSCPSGALKPCGDGDSCTWDTCDPVDGCKIMKVVALPASATCDGAVTGDRCAQAFKAKGTWQQARQACWAWGGDLAPIHSVQEGAALRGLATKVCGKVSAWIGLSDQAKEGLWRWTDGSAPGYLNWSKGEPNNSNNEDYAEMGAAGTWNDLGAAHTRDCHLCAKAMAPTCDDGDACTPPGVCGAQGCVQSQPPSGCDDADPCTVDLCAAVTGCGHEAVQDGLPCGPGGTCGGGTCVLPQEATLTAVSCLAIKQALPSAPSGVWWLDPDGATGPDKPFAAYCDMAADGGGWTLVLKVDGTKNTLQYDAKAWTDTSVIAPDKPALDLQEAKLASYHTVAFSQVRLRMRTAVGTGDKQVVHTRAATLTVKAGSLHALIAPGKPVPTALGVGWWKALLPQPSLQMSCQVEGFNAAPKPTTARVRIGIVGNNENDCETSDSWLGIGGNANACGQKQGNAAGNIACHAPSNGYVATRSFAWVLVR